MKGSATSFKKILTCVLLGIMVMTAFTACGSEKAPDRTGPENTLQEEISIDKSTEVVEIVEPSENEPENVIAADSVFELHFLDVDQGTSVLINCDDHWMLYDGGDSGTSSYVVSYLKKQAVERLDYVIASHYDADHINGLNGALSVFPCDMVLLPDYEGDTETYEKFKDRIDANGAVIRHPEQGDRLKFASAEIEITGPYTYTYTEENNRSICARVNYGETRFLMCGDAEEQAESDMVRSCADLTANVLVVGHHGSGNSSTTRFLNAVNPQYALISCKLANSYGHPAANALQRLKNVGCQLYRTDLQDNIIAYSDGYSVSFNQEPTDDWRSGGDIKAEREERQQEEAVAATTAVESTADREAGTSADYIINKNTGKFHYPNCRSVKQMNESNKIYSTESREYLIGQGYSPCANCNP